MLRVFSRSLVVPDLDGRNCPIHYGGQAPSGLARHFICVLSLLVLTTVAAATVSGQTQPRSGRSGTRPQLFEMLGISVEGNSVAEPAAIIANAGLKIGDELAIPGDQSAEAIRRLWALRIFSDVQILVERTVGTGVYLLIRVKEFPRLERIEIEGEDEVSEKDILKKVNLIKGQILTPQGMNRIVKDVKKLYEEKGFLLTAIHSETVDAPEGKNSSVLRLVIEEGKDVRVGKITFTGNTVFDDGDLRGEMDTGEKTWWKFWSKARLDREKFKEDKKKIVDFYRKRGYRDAQVLGDSIWYNEVKDRMYIQISVYEGPQYKIRNIAWEGNTVYPERILNARLGLGPGDVFNMERFQSNLYGNKDQTDVASLYLDTGYLVYNATTEVVPVAEDSVDIRIRVQENNQFRIGQVEIRGNTKTKEKVIRRELLTRPGDYFSRAAIIRSLRQLSILNYFNPEKLNPDTRIVDDKTVDVIYEVEEKSSDTFNASVGFSGAFGVTGALGLTFNNFDIARPLRGGGGQQLAFEWQFGEGARFRTFSLSFTEPWLFDTPTSFGWSVFDTRQKFGFDIRLTGASVRVGRRFKWPDDYFRGDWMVRFQSTDVISGAGRYLEGRDSQISIQQVISRNSINNPIFPSEGSTVSLSVEVSGGPILPGSIEFHKWTFNADWYTPFLGSPRFVLYASSQFGYVNGFRETSRIPPTELFLMGGTAVGLIGTVPLRGYEDQEVGPRNELGQTLAGRMMTRHTAELRFAVSMNPIPIFLLAFVEAGNVWENLSRADYFDLRESAGFGARLQIQPIGLLGFDYAYGFDDVFPQDGQPDGWRFHFQFGRSF